MALLNLIPPSVITGIDIFPNPDVEARFDRNTAPYGERVHKIEARGVPTMDDFAARKRKFDIIYLDSAKLRADCFAQSCSCMAASADRRRPDLG